MNILLIDDHKLFCHSLKVVLEMYSEIDNVDIYNNGGEHREFFDIIKNYDIILVDINLGNLIEESGLSLAAKILKENTEANIVLLTGHNKAIYEFEAMKMGAKGFIDKEVDPEMLLKLLKRIIKGEKIFSLQAMEGKGIKNIIKTKTQLIEELTSREKEILCRIYVGNDIETIARDIGVSRRTIFNHLGRIYSKLGAKNKQEAINKAETLGYFMPK